MILFIRRKIWSKMTIRSAHDDHDDKNIADDGVSGGEAEERRENGGQ